MDDPNVDPQLLAKNFSDIERANRWFGGVAPLEREVFSRDAVRLLDVGCGSGDVARALIRAARRRGRRLDIVGLDCSPAVLAIARDRSAAEPLLSFTAGDARALPFADGAFDLATCNLALHHFDPPYANEVLRELRRVARITPLVFDLRRSPIAYMGALAFAWLLSASPLTRHDAPLSALRAYTPGEALELARAAGWRNPRVKRCAFGRMMLRDDA